MLPDRDRELLTAYVDGELSSRQRRHVVRLLQRSPEARALLLRLQEDARSLKGLPRAHPVEDLSASVLRNIVERGLHHARRRAAACAVTPFPAWAGAVAAAAVLLAAGLGSYLYFASSLSPRHTDPVASKPTEKTAPVIEGTQPVKPLSQPEKVARGEARSAPKGTEVARAKPAHPARPEHVASAKEIPSRARRSHPDPGPKPPASDPLAAQQNDLIPRIQRFQVELPSVVALRELEQPPQRRKLAEELRKSPAAHLELPCRDGTRAMQRLLTVLKAQKIEGIVEPGAQGRLKSPQWQTNYAVYVEDLTPDELAQLFQAVGAEEKKGIAHRPPDVRFTGQLVVARMTAEEHRELKLLLGVDPLEPRHKVPGSKAVDLHRPLSEQTGEHVNAALAGKGVPRPVGGKAKPKPGHRAALVMVHGGLRPRRESAEIKRFLAGRRPPRPGTVSVLLLVRTVAV